LPKEKWNELIVGDMEYMWYILLASSVLGLIAAVAVMMTATHGRSTFWRMVRCFGGFTCSMVWIAAIADEVVSVLQVSQSLEARKVLISVHWRIDGIERCHYRLDQYVF
jgi:hypothetical protein